jgi:hypothetical protein
VASIDEQESDGKYCGNLEERDNSLLEEAVELYKYLFI